MRPLQCSHSHRIIRMDYRPFRLSAVTDETAGNIHGDTYRTASISPINKIGLFPRNALTESYSNQRVHNNIRVIEERLRLFGFFYFPDRNHHFLAYLIIQAGGITHVRLIPHEENHYVSFGQRRIAGGNKAVAAIVATPTENNHSGVFPGYIPFGKSNDRSSRVFHKDSLRQPIGIHCQSIQFSRFISVQQLHLYLLS